MFKIVLDLRQLNGAGWLALTEEERAVMRRLDDSEVWVATDRDIMTVAQRDDPR